MDTTIYSFGKPDKPIESTELNFEFDDNPAPKLIKYGFNNITEELDLTDLMTNPHYKAGLSFDFERKDDLSFTTLVETDFNIKNFNQTFAEFWEILTMFNLLNNDQNILTSNKKEVQNIIDLYKKMSKDKNKLVIAKDNDNKISLIIQKYSNINIDENAAIQFIINDLPLLLQSQTTNGNMILQLFNTQTQAMAEIIYYLTNFYNEAYLIKPTVIPDLSNSKYLVLIGLNDNPKFIIPKHPKNVYLHSIGLKTLPNNFTTVIQCFNSDIMPRKYRKYHQIKSYLDTKVYEGATYQDFIIKQNENSKKWLEIFKDLSGISKVTDDTIQKSSKRCSVYNKLANVLQ